MPAAAIQAGAEVRGERAVGRREAAKGRGT
jgi:hypothetical protein